jgi:AcrR family transcriptional regulator
MKSGGSVPRRYTLGKRGDAMAETRARIVAATLDIYRERGIGAATIPAVARAADVAAATVRNHFRGPAELAEAAAAAILAELRMPDEGIFEGIDGVGARVERLIRDVVAFYERGTGWWEVRERDRVRGNAWAGPEAAYQADFADLIAAALGPLSSDSVVSAVVATVIEPLYFSLRASGSTPEAAIEVQLAIVLPWLDRRVSGSNSRSMQPSGDGSRADRTPE